VPKGAFMSSVQGFLFATAKGNFRYADREDLALIYMPEGGVIRGVFTQNFFQAAPIIVAKQHITTPIHYGVMINAGQANAGTGKKGIEDCQYTLELLAKHLQIKPEQILPASTGVIGEFFNLSKWELAIPKLVQNLGQAKVYQVARAIMTTDKYPKLIQKTFSLGSTKVQIIGLAKGAGMIAPNMATLLGFVLTDLELEPDWWQQCISKAVDESFNRISVDGDTSTNDLILGLSSKKRKLDLDQDDLVFFQQQVTDVCQQLAYLIVQDGEGATKVARLIVRGAASKEQAQQIAKTISCSLLVKTALFGGDPNWGRIIAALGRSGVELCPEKVRIAFGEQEVFSQGRAVLEDVDAFLQGYMQRKDIHVYIDLGQGDQSYWCLFSDLSLDYVKLNSAYRS